MKKQLKAYMLMVGAILFLTQAATTTPNSDGETTGTDAIELRGKFKTGGLRSGGDAITVELQGSIMMATFHRDLGNVQVTLTNNKGVPIYECTVNTTIQTQVFISLSGLPYGTYTITFSNGLGAMYGDFEI